MLNYKRQLYIVLFSIAIITISFFHTKFSIASSFIGLWTETNSLPSGIASQYTFTKENKIYTIGGANNSVTSSGNYAQINIDGTINNWQGLSSQPTRLWHSGANINNFIYILGGSTNGTTNTNKVTIGTIDGSGDITSWQETTPLPNNLSLGATIIFDNKIYYAGGSTSQENGSSAKNEIYVSSINPDGTLSSWSLAGYLPEPLLGFGMIESNGYLLIIGGKNSQNSIVPDVKKARIDPDSGSVGTWINLPSLPKPSYRNAVAKTNNAIIVSGGYFTSPSFTLIDNVYYADVNPDMDISSWTDSINRLPIPLCCHSMTSFENNLYASGGWSTSYLDTVYTSKIESLPTPTPTSTPTPTVTATPTPTATATPNYPVLSVPSLKQYSLPWKNRIYDHTRSTIEEFGCALTSATMVLNYHGHNILPDALNNWLRNQKDGYIRNGLINWLAVSRYTKENDTNSSPTLEYKRLEATNENLDNELNSNRPAILKEDGHFIVATAKNEDTYLINDPGYSDRDTLESYGNSFLAINSYRPTHTDLSYMMFVVDNDINLQIKDFEGNVVDTIVTTEEPIKSIKNANKVSGDTVKVYLLEKPQQNKYQLLLSGQKGQYKLESYLYNTNGKVTQNEFKGKLTGSDTDKFNISFEGKNKIKKNDNNGKHSGWYNDFFTNFRFWL